MNPLKNTGLFSPASIGTLLVILVIIPFPAVGTAETMEGMKNLIGNRDALLVSAPDGKIVFSKNCRKQLIPASTIKILTALVALHYLKPGHRFYTDFYLDRHKNLKIKGYGDPCLTSESLVEISEILSTRLRRFNDLLMDSSYFSPLILIPGITSSQNPYDAPNNALSVNFNTIFFKKEKGVYVSAEHQTPMLDIALKRIKASSLNYGRIPLSQEDIIPYAGHLFLFFFDKGGIATGDKVRPGKIRPDTDKMIFRYTSSFSLEQVIRKLFEYSNNFIANQLLIASGAKAFGPPGTLNKGVQAASDYLKNNLKINDVFIAEGSGLSRKNRISASDLHTILKTFEPYRHLMKRKGREFYKTGTLSGVKTRVGYIENSRGGLYRFVLLINTPGQSTKKIMARLMQSVE